MEKSGKRWTIFRLIYIVSIFFIVINKTAKNRQELLHQPNINITLIKVTMLYTLF